MKSESVLKKKKENPTDVSFEAVFRYSAFYDLLADASFQHRRAVISDDSFLMNRFSRASILASALSIECVANSLMASLKLPNKLGEELDKLPPMTKIETYLRFRGVDGFERGRLEVQQVAELIKIRNEHVHPKASSIPAKATLPQDGGNEWLFPFSLEGEMWSQLKIPKRSMFWSATSSQAILIAVANFFRFLFVDVLSMEEGDLRDMLHSRIEINKPEIYFDAMYDEVRNELKNAKEFMVDLSFFKIFKSENT